VSLGVISLCEELQKHANPEKARILQGFFKTGRGEYGEGDVFLGITVPQSREIAKQFAHIELNEVKKHLQSKIHEERLIALLILVEKYKKSDDKKEIADFYLSNTKHINNWDLVDLSADRILGGYLFDKDKKMLFELAESANLWKRRIAIVSTFNFIKQGRFDETLRIAELLIKDKHDLIHKACGWMLREVGKRDEKVLKDFLKKNYKHMPRTMLRYAIERFPEEERKKYLTGTI